MEREEFLNAYLNFEGTNRRFSESDWVDALNNWEKYYEMIISDEGLPFDRWIKNEKYGYLPDFLDTKEQRFGHARIGNYEYVMVYQYTGSDKKRKAKYRSAYSSSDRYDCKENASDVEPDYVEHIKPLIRQIVSASTIDEVYETEKSPEYIKFTCKSILRKISILNSVRDESPYENAFMWIYSDSAVEALAELLDVNIDEESYSFLEKNKLVYDKAKEFANITEASTKSDYIKLYDFLWYLSDASFNVKELMDFNSINVIYNGAPGTGKTYGVVNGIKRLQSINSKKYRNYKYIQFHPSFTYQDFIEGIKPFGVNSGTLDLQVVNGSFKDFCIFVCKENEKYYSEHKEEPDVDKPETWPHYYFVVDEINRGNLSNIFGETFTLIERDYRDYDFTLNYKVDKENSIKNNHLISTALSSVISRLEKKDDIVYKEIDGEVYFGIPFNIHFIGIMNDVDRSIDSFDLALRRRFKWIQKYCDYEVIAEKLIEKRYKSETVTDYIDYCKALNDFICTDSKDGLCLGRSYEIGHSFFMHILDIPGQKTITMNKRKLVFENYIEGTLKEYIRQVADESEISNLIDRARNAFGIEWLWQKSQN